MDSYRESFKDSLFAANHFRILNPKEHSAHHKDDKPEDEGIHVRILNVQLKIQNYKEKQR